MRQTARITGLARETVARRMRSMGEQCRAVQEELLHGGHPRLRGTYLLDELETFETDRRLRPVTVPVLLQRGSLFVVYACAGPLAPRGRLDAWHARRLEEETARSGRRRCGSKVAVRKALEYLDRALVSRSSLNLTTDRKSSYPELVRAIFSRRFGSHARESSKRRRDRGNPLFPVNHTLAMMRDGISRLVRRSWAASKLRARLEDHIWIWVAYRNYVRGITVDAPRTTPAMVAGIAQRPWTSREIFRWKWQGRMPGGMRPAE